MADVIAPENEEGTKATMLRWCKAAGEAIRKDEPLLELETDKVTVEVPSPASGELAEILKQPNEEVQPGQILARVRIARRPPPGPRTRSARLAAAPAPRRGARRGRRELVSPAVRRLLDEHALSRADIEGSGRDGRITAQDVARYLGEMRPAHPRPGAGDARYHRENAPSARVSRSAAAAARHRVPHTSIRRRVAEHMTSSLAQAPHVTTLFEADLTRVQAHRARNAAEYERQGIRLTSPPISSRRAPAPCSLTPR